MPGSIPLERHVCITRRATFGWAMIMAFWGAPLKDESQQEHAINTALLMLEKVEEIRLVFTESGYPPLMLE